MNGVELDNSLALSGKKPNASNYQLLIGRSDENGRILFRQIYVNQEGDWGNDAESTVRLNYDATGAQYDHCFVNNLDTKETHGVCDWDWKSWSVGANFQFWEDDDSPVYNYNGGDDWLFGQSLNGTDMNTTTAKVRL